MTKELLLVHPLLLPLMETFISQRLGSRLYPSRLGVHQIDMEIYDFDVVLRMDLCCDDRPSEEMCTFRPSECPIVRVLRNPMWLNDFDHFYALSQEVAR